MSFALIKNWLVMVRTPTGAVWRSWIRGDLPADQIMTWPTRDGARLAAEMQGAAVVPVSQIRVRP